MLWIPERLLSVKRKGEADVRRTACSLAALDPKPVVQICTNKRQVLPEPVIRMQTIAGRLLHNLRYSPT